MKSKMKIEIVKSGGFAGIYHEEKVLNVDNNTAKRVSETLFNGKPIEDGSFVHDGFNIDIRAWDGKEIKKVSFCQESALPEVCDLMDDLYCLIESEKE